VHYWADLQSVHGFRCYDDIAPNAKCQPVLVLRTQASDLQGLVNVVRKTLNVATCFLMEIRITATNTYYHYLGLGYYFRLTAVFPD